MTSVQAGSRLLLCLSAVCATFIGVFHFNQQTRCFKPRLELTSRHCNYYTQVYGRAHRSKRVFSAQQLCQHWIWDQAGPSHIPGLCATHRPGVLIIDPDFNLLVSQPKPIPVQPNLYLCHKRLHDEPAAHQCAISVPRAQHLFHDKAALMAYTTS